MITELTIFRELENAREVWTCLISGLGGLEWFYGIRIVWKTAAIGVTATSHFEHGKKLHLRYQIRGLR